MKSAFKIGLVSLLALTTAAPAFAQYQPTQQYQRDLRQYQEDREDYATARAAYDRRLADYEAARDAYDRRYGAGAYARYYGPAPTWDTTYDDRRDARPDVRPDGYRDNGPRNDAYGRGDGYGRDRYDRDDRGRAYNDPCRQRSNNNTAVGGIIGALAGAAIGSNVAARNARTEGAVLGAVVGGVAGASIGKQSTKCDANGYYFTYSETVPYRESRYDRYRRSGQYGYSYYTRQRCRLAAAPIDWEDRGREVRYVRVCPDAQGRYRVTG
jgi:surface antigen